MITHQPEMTWQSELFASSTSFAAVMEDRSVAEGRQRLSPRVAFQELLFERAHLVDIRPPDQRAIEGGIAQTLHSEGIANPGLRLILLCQDGHASSLAADALAGLGVHRTTAVIGGFDAWRSLGLPVRA